MAKRRSAGTRDRTAAIVEAALSLAMEGGFENVRQREVAARAGVTLRTLYRKFPSKDELLAVGLLRAADELDRRIAARPIRERSAAGRLAHLFAEMTDVFCGNPNLGRSVIRVLASGSCAAGSPVLAYQGRVALLVVEALRGPRAAGEPTVAEVEIATLLILIWLAGLFSWAAGTVEPANIAASIEMAIRHLVPDAPRRSRK
jgi:AcrR family transcriptional regulator